VKINRTLFVPKSLPWRLSDRAPIRAWLEQIAVIPNSDRSKFCADPKLEPLPVPCRNSALAELTLRVA